jgi:hypothetical protein
LENTVLALAIGIISRGLLRFQMTFSDESLPSPRLVRKAALDSPV